MTIPPPCLLSLHILRPVGLFPLFLPQDTVNALSDFLCFFHFLFECKIPPVERFPLGGQLGILRFPCLCRDCGLAIHHAFQIIFRRRKQDLLAFRQRLLSLIVSGFFRKFNFCHLVVASQPAMISDNSSFPGLAG